MKQDGHVYRTSMQIKWRTHEHTSQLTACSCQSTANIFVRTCNRFAANL